MAKVPELFGSMVFNDQMMLERLPKATYKALKKTIQNGEPLDESVANVVASAMKDWAIEKGCTHYTHWFQPMTGITAEKHDSFITPNGDGQVIMEFSGKELVKGEPDASSFPSGGIRATFEARGYTTWDPTSYAFAKDGTLYIPTAFCSYTGEVLDKKTPLLRSMERISTEACKVLNLLGKTDVTRVTTTVGPEQEYFLIDKDVYDQRKDLIYTGRTLFGAKAPKGQELDDHYFGAIKTRVASFMADLDNELWKLGILAKTKHNEVAPSQHELAPIFTTTNIATDHNELTMEVMKKIAEKHGLVCLLHEKPFAGVNGSGKHNNWSISTNTGENLLDPGKTPETNIQFQLFLAAIVKAVHEYQDLLRISVASAGNDHRLGANEAPPAIISMYLGDDLGALVESIINGTEYISKGKVKMSTGVDVLPDFKKDTSDRNRTSPFAFTGNKFEFRALGSALNIACPNIMLNTMVAEELSEFYDELKDASDLDAAVKALIKKTFTEHQAIIFNGNNYAPEWVEEAEKRGLLNLKSLPDAVEHYIDQKNIDLFTKNKIYSVDEIHARYEIELENYAKIINIEALTMIDMAKKDMIPAVTSYVRELTDTALAKKALSDAIPTSVEEDLITSLSNKLVCFSKKTAELENAVIGASEYEGDVLAYAKYYRESVFSVMTELRAIGDAMETETAADYWPYPSYGEMLYGV
ncbi:MULTISPECIES: glutamine synthetase III [Ruminococcus]|jgi:glutamine synthetase|uniref:Glutamine synthetase type III n=2 Tax=Ruminococcus TaxID=1263 RepID=A0ABT0NIK5_9FIRM|nr:glutamine synthetase III [Ruminococcus bromii]MCL3787473.1 glutamine synthetase type III [Ruminococcus bromii]MDR3970709.1 glutamine synthetase III [Ruminococcus sp.]MDR4008217.1 glutamine synthetase III [Ruminococcus sp.]